MYDIAAVRWFDMTLITFLFSLVFVTGILMVLGLWATLRIRDDAHVMVLSGVILADMLLIVCETYSLKALITRRQHDIETDMYCNIAGFILSLIHPVTWWSLALAHAVKMWQVRITRCHVIVLHIIIWIGGSVIAALPIIFGDVYEFSWTHAHCVDGDRKMFGLQKHSFLYVTVFSILTLIQYTAPVLICIVSIARDLQPNRKRTRVGWSCTVMLFLLQTLIYVLWWFDDAKRHLVQTFYPVPTWTIIRQTSTIVVLYLKPVLDFLIMYKSMSEFRSAVLKNLNLDFPTASSYALMEPDETPDSTV